MEQLNNLVQSIKMRLKPVLIQNHLNSRRVSLVVSLVGALFSVGSYYILSLSDRPSFIFNFGLSMGIISISFAFFGPLFSINSHFSYKKLLNKEWTGTVKDEATLSESAQQLNKEEIQALMNISLPPQLFRYIDSAIREKGFITHDDLYEMLQHEQDSVSAKSHYENFIKNIQCDNAQQKQNLQQLLDVAGVNQNHKTFNSKNTL